MSGPGGLPRPRSEADAGPRPAPRPPAGLPGCRRRDRARGLWNLLNLSTPLGVAGAVATGCALSPGPHGLLRADGWRFPFPGGAAFTVGDVVFTRPGLRMTDDLWRHEGTHSAQYAACLGLPFLPLYAAAVAWSTWRTGDPASRNPFERGAGLVRGGYVERAVVRGPGRARPDGHAGPGKRV